MKTFEELTKSEKLDIIEAFLDGEEVEVLMSIWEPLKAAAFYPQACYRVVPKTPDYIDWDHVHPDFNYMTRDEYGVIGLYDHRPVLSIASGRWVWQARTSRYINISGVFASYEKGTVGWMDSLVRRQKPKNEIVLNNPAHQA